MKRILLLIVGFLLAYDTHAQVKVYEKFSEFEREFIKANHADTVYVINFWATWCKPCVEELTYFEGLEKEYEGKPTKVVLVSLDMKDKINTSLIPFINRRQLKREVVVLTDGDFNSWIDLVDPSWSGAIPATFILYKDRKAFFEKSYTSQLEIEKDITNQIVKQK